MDKQLSETPTKSKRCADSITMSHLPFPTKSNNILYTLQKTSNRTHRKLQLNSNCFIKSIHTKDIYTTILL